MLPMQELVVLLNEKFEPIGTMPKSEVHTGDTPLHRAFSLFIFNNKNELLLQQRSYKKVAFPLVWTNSCCGHPLPDESYEDAAKRRAAFELGLENLDPKMTIPDYRYKASMHGIVENEFCPVLTARTDDQPIPNNAEIEAIRWIPWEEWVRETKEHPENYSPWCVEETALLEKKLGPSFSL